MICEDDKINYYALCKGNTLADPVSKPLVLVFLLLIQFVLMILLFLFCLTEFASNFAAVVIDVFPANAFVFGQLVDFASLGSSYCPASAGALELAGVIKAHRSLHDSEIDAIGISFSAVRYVPLIRMSKPSLESKIIAATIFFGCPIF